MEQPPTPSPGTLAGAWGATESPAQGVLAPQPARPRPPPTRVGPSGAPRARHSPFLALLPPGASFRAPSSSILRSRPGQAQTRTSKQRRPRVVPLRKGAGQRRQGTGSSPHPPAHAPQAQVDEREGRLSRRPQEQTGGLPQPQFSGLPSDRKPPPCSLECPPGTGNSHMNPQFKKAPPPRKTGQELE